VHHRRFSVNDEGADQHLRRFSVNDMGADQHLRRLQKDDKLVKSCCTTDWKICNISPLHIPKPCSLLGTIYTFLAIWQCVHRCFRKCCHSTHTRPLAVRPFLSTLCLVVGRGV
jgi:hypothetical protein